MTTRFDPRGFPARRALSAFLATSTTMLMGRVDSRGMVLAANPALGRWIEESPGPRLAMALRPRSRARWQAALADTNRRRSLTLGLWFGAGATREALYRCRLVREEGGTFWLIGEAATATTGREATTETSAANQALRDKLARARRLARTDALTGVASRRRGLNRLVAWTRRARRRGTPLSCLMVDLDRFKAINDTFGHPFGDSILRIAAQTLARGMRGSDLLARYGGDEFLILLPGTTEADALTIADRLRTNLAGRPLAQLGRPLDACVGVATIDRGESARGLLARADAALLRAKRDGRGRVALAPPAPPNSGKPPSSPEGVPSPSMGENATRR